MKGQNFYRPDGTPCTEDEAMIGTVLKDGYTYSIPMLMRDSAMHTNDIEKAAIIRSDIMLASKRVLGDGYDPTCKSNVTIQRDVVRQLIGDAANTMAGEELSGAFKAAIIAGDQGGHGGSHAASDKAYAEYRASLSDMWMSPAQRA